MQEAAKLPLPDDELGMEAIIAFTVQRPFDVTEAPPPDNKEWLTTQASGRYKWESRDYEWRPVEKPRVLAKIKDAPWADQNPVGKNLWLVSIEGREYFLNGAIGIYISRKWLSSVHYIKAPAPGSTK